MIISFRMTFLPIIVPRSPSPHPARPHGFIKARSALLEATTAAIGAGLGFEFSGVLRGPGGHVRALGGVEEMGTGKSADRQTSPISLHSAGARRLRMEGLRDLRQTSMVD